MNEKIIKLQERLSFTPITTAGHLAISTPVIEGAFLSTPPEAGRETDLQATSAPIQTEEPTKARPGSHDLEKDLSKLPSQPAHYVSKNHSKVTHVNPEDERDEDRPKEHAIWILVGTLTPNKQSFPPTGTESIGLSLRPVASSRTTNSTVYHIHGHSTSAAPSTVLLLEAITYLCTLSSTPFAATRLSAQTHILILRH